MRVISTTTCIATAIGCALMGAVLGSSLAGMLPDRASAISQAGLGLTVSISCLGLLGGCLFLRRSMKHRDPSSVIPDRVRTMLDALAEGVVVMDNDEQIVMANDAFCRITGTGLSQIQGRKLSDISALAGGACAADGAEKGWIELLNSSTPVRRMTVRVGSAETGMRSLVLNIVPVPGNDGTRKGVLATFDDVTSVESMNTQLRDALDELARSRDEISRQNRELQVVASRDPLTGCFNRRAFMRSFEELWATAIDKGQPLACIMLDIDHFKGINDRYGHAVGDQVLKHLGQVLQSTFRSQDLICRYGGEEFCVLLPNASFEAAHAVAWRLRAAILACDWPITNVTASIGVSAVEAGAPDCRQMLEQADRALYAAKRTGRNRVVAWGDPCMEGTLVDKFEERRDASSLLFAKQVTHAMVEVLARWDFETAAHSKRVAALACQLFDGDESEKEWVRMAALLHDIGKVSVPLTILHKQGPLTDEEWEVMSQHERLGADLVQEAIGSPRITEMIRTHHAWYSGNDRHPTLPVADNIPLSARCILLADAYDAMVSDRSYRKAMSHEDACQELRRFAGRQFDARLVARFIAQLEAAPMAQADYSDSDDLAALAAQADELARFAASAAAPAIPAEQPPAVAPAT